MAEGIELRTLSVRVRRLTAELFASARQKYYDQKVFRFYSIALLIVLITIGSTVRTAHYALSLSVRSKTILIT